MMYLLITCMVYAGETCNESLGTQATPFHSKEGCEEVLKKTEMRCTSVGASYECREYIHGEALGGTLARQPLEFRKGCVKGIN